MHSIIKGKADVHIRVTGQTLGEDHLLEPDIHPEIRQEKIQIIDSIQGNDILVTEVERIAGRDTGLIHDHQDTDQVHDHQDERDGDPEAMTDHDM